MSLKPLKKSDTGKDWMPKRLDNSRSISPEYHLIVSEGTDTEPNYFYSVKERINRKFKGRIQLEISGEGDNTVNLFKIARQYAQESPNGYKHVWIVYDTDDFPPEHNNAIAELCKAHSTKDCKYHAIWSNQCIELWFLLHFSYMHSDLHRKEYFPKLSKCLNDISAGDYEKIVPTYSMFCCRILMSPLQMQRSLMPRIKIKHRQSRHPAPRYTN